MARALLVGCGCCGREAGRLLAERGWAVRGTARTDAGLEAIAAAGLDPARADPDRAGTIVGLVGDVTVVGWLLGSARGSRAELEAVHGPRLEAVLAKLVDSPVRGFVYEGTGTVDAALLGGGEELVRAAQARWRMPTAVLRADRADPAAWAREAAAAIERAVGLRAR